MRSNRSLPVRTYLLAAAALILGALAGCAHSPRTASPVARAEPAAQPAQPSTQVTGLWERIRLGMDLPPTGEHARIDAWVAYYNSHRSHLLGSAQRAEPFLWHIVEAIEERGMPLELALLPIVESGFQPRAYSHSGAAGLWQFIPGTARRFGLETNWWYSGRLDALEETRAALDYLTWLHDRFGNWLLALAAYNCGENCVGRAREDAILHGQPQDYWHFDLPAETEDYVPKLLALKQLLLHPDRYALTWPNIPNRPLTATVDLPGQVDLALAAELVDLAPERMRDLNAAFRRGVTHPHDDHSLLVPIASADALRKALAAADPDTLVAPYRRHRVVRGDTLTEIAAHFDTSVARIQTVNDLSGGIIYPGQMLLLPGARLAAPEPEPQPRARIVKAPARSSQPLETVARRYPVRAEDPHHRESRASHAVLHPRDPRPAPAISEDAVAVSGHGVGVAANHTVRHGQTLWSIAQRYAVDVKQLRAWNRLPTGGVLYAGQTLRVGQPTGDKLVTYRVRDDDTLWSIAQRFGVEVGQVRRWNGLTGNHIETGQKLQIQVSDAI